MLSNGQNMLSTETSTDDGVDNPIIMEKESVPLLDGADDPQTKKVKIREGEAVEMGNGLEQRIDDMEVQTEGSEEMPNLINGVSFKDTLMGINEKGSS